MTTEIGAAAPSLPLEGERPLLRGSRAGHPRHASDLGRESQTPAILSRESTSRRLLALADSIAILLTVLVAVELAGGDQLTWAVLATAPLLVLVCKAIGLYDRDENLLHKTTLDEVPKLFAIATGATLLLYLSGSALVSGGLDRGQIALTWGLLLFTIVTLRSLTRAYARSSVPSERCLFVGDSAGAEEFREKLESSSSVKAQLVGWMPDDGIAAELEEPATRASMPERMRRLIAERGVHRVVIGPGPSDSGELLDSIRRIKGNAIKVSVLPDVARVVNYSVELDRLHGITLLGMRRFELSSSSRVIKRAFDLAVSALALVVLAPVLAAIAIAIKLDSPGPVLFRQQRSGRHGEPFEMLKFRTMVDGADEIKDGLRHLNEAEDGLFKIADDPRVTRVGGLLRRLHLDELPQLVNVLAGQMSVVGPRPLVLDEDRRIEGWHRRRLDLRPGMTGPWQALGAARIPLREMVRLDYQYIADWSLWNDVRILLLTIPVVIRRRGL